MGTTKVNGPGWSWTSQEMGIVIYSILVAFLILSWAHSSLRRPLPRGDVMLAEPP